jgi:hypothetical protein
MYIYIYTGVGAGEAAVPAACDAPTLVKLSDIYYYASLQVD